MSEFGPNGDPTGPNFKRPTIDEPGDGEIQAAIEYFRYKTDRNGNRVPGNNWRSKILPWIPYLDPDTRMAVADIMGALNPYERCEQPIPNAEETEEEHPKTRLEDAQVVEVLKNTPGNLQLLVSLYKRTQEEESTGQPE